MEVFGSTFDDSVFLESRDRASVALSSYNAKFCEPEWFFESKALDTEDCLEKQKVFKFRGDFAFRQGDFQKSLDAYSNCLEWIPDNNLSIRREVLEGMARCCTKLGQKQRALDLVDALSKEVSNTCHLTCLLLLKVSVHRHFGAMKEKMAVLQQLCSLVPYNPWHWYSLANTCLEVLNTDQSHGSSDISPSPSSVKDTAALGSCAVEPDSAAAELNHRLTEESREEDEEMEDRDKVWLKACMCFIRTRLLLRILMQQQSSFVLERSKSTLQRIDETLERLHLEENVLQILTEVMSEDLIPEKMREDSQDGESLATVCLRSFTERWWSKILQTGVSGAHGLEQQTETEAKP